MLHFQSECVAVFCSKYKLTLQEKKIGNDGKSVEVRLTA